MGYRQVRTYKSFSILNLFFFLSTIVVDVGRPFVTSAVLSNLLCQEWDSSSLCECATIVSIRLQMTSQYFNCQVI